VTYERERPAAAEPSAWTIANFVLDTSGYDETDEGKRERLAFSIASVITATLTSERSATAHMISDMKKAMELAKPHLAVMAVLNNSALEAYEALSVFESK
jgi:hypothetical protein